MRERERDRDAEREIERESRDREERESDDWSWCWLCLIEGWFKSEMQGRDVVNGIDWWCVVVRSGEGELEVERFEEIAEI